MNKRFAFGSLLAGGLVSISLITGCGSSAPEQTTEEPAPTEESAKVPAPAPAANPTPTPVPQTAPPPTPTPVAASQSPAPVQQSASVGSEYCPNAAGGTPQIEFYQTKGFNIYLCGGDGEIFYHGVDKKNGNSITLPATYRNGAGYVAVNGSTTYIINESSLTVLDNGKEILSQSVQ